MSGDVTKALLIALREFLAVQTECDPNDGPCRLCLAEELQHAVRNPPGEEVQSNG